MPNQTLFARPPILFALLVAATLAGPFSGCASLDLGVLSFGPSVTIPEIPPNAPTYSVEIYPASGTPQRASAPLADKMTVAEAVRQTRVDRKFGRRKFFLLRKTPRGETVKMPVNWDSRRKTISPETDYAMYPGDRLAVVEDTSSPLADAIKFLPPALRMSSSSSGRRR